MKDHGDAGASHELLVDFGAVTNSADFPAQLTAVVDVVASLVGAECSINGQKLQPITVAKKATPLVEKWSGLISYLHARMGGKRAGVDVMISSVKAAVAGLLAPDAATGQRAAKESIFFGLLLSLREHIDTVTDDDLRESCSELLEDSKAKKMFVAYLQESDDEEADSDDNEDVRAAE